MFRTAFSITIIGDQAPHDIVPNQIVRSNIGNAFDAKTYIFITPRCGLYWFNLNFKISTKLSADISIAGTQSFPSLGLLKADNMSIDTVDRQSCDDIVWLSSRSQIYITSPLYSILEMTSWIGFKLDDWLNILIVFNVYQNSTIITPSSPNPVPFTLVTVNEGESWDATTYKFSAPIDGVYIFSYNTASIANTPTSFNLVKDGIVSYNADSNYTGSAGVDSASRSVPVRLNRGQRVWVTGNGMMSYGNRYKLSSFKGFFYSPVQGTQVVWSVHTTNAHLQGSNPVVFPIIESNQGNAWVSSSNKVVIKVAGTYYVNIVGTQQPMAGISLHVLLNGNLEAIILFKSWQAYNGFVTREMADILQLKVNDELHVNANGGEYQGYISFCGFLLHF